MIEIIHAFDKLPSSDPKSIAISFVYKSRMDESMRGHLPIKKPKSSQSATQKKARDNLLC